MRKALYILADLQDQDLTWLRDAGAQRRISPGEVIIREGEPVTSLFVVIEGRLEVVLEDDKRIAELSVGDIVGEMSLIEKRPPSASVRALAATRLLAVPQERVRSRLETDPQFAARFYRALAVFLSDRLRSTVATLGYGKAREEESAQQTLERENELDEGLLDTLHVAGDRMRRLISMLENAKS